MDRLNGGTHHRRVVKSPQWSRIGTAGNGDYLNVMAFWIIAALLTLAASMAVFVPLARRGDAAGRSGSDLDVYRDQLAEVERDIARGLIEPVEAEQARAEIGRRILRLSEAGQGRGRPARGLASAIGGAAVLLVPLLSWGVYGALGSPDLPSQPLEARLSKLPAESSTDELVARVERALKQNPEDGRGWDVVAPVYQRLGRADEAVFAYRNTIRLLGDSAARSAGLGEALSDAAGGTVSAEALAAFERALELDPGSAKARFFVGIAAAQEGRYDEAIAGWSRMAAELPADSEWRRAAEQAIDVANQRRTAEASSPRGPSAVEMQDAADMTAAERGEMIEAMVASLDEKLKANPDDAEGWKRLVRSYVVLGKVDAARDAVMRGRRALTDSGRADELAQFAASLGIEMTEQE